MSSAPSSSDSSSSSNSESGTEEKHAKAKKDDNQDDKTAKVTGATEVVVSDSASDSDSESSSKSKKKKDKKREKQKQKKTKDRKKSIKKKKDKKDKKRKAHKKRDKKEKSKKAKKKGTKGTLKKKRALGEVGSVSNQFGKFGILKQEDFYIKRAEFTVWAMEVKKISIDSMGQMKQKDLFKEYVEDYNTATMPSKKYYNLQVWDTEQSFKRQKRAKTEELTSAGKASLAAFDDESARREEIKHIQAKKQEEKITEEVRRMRGDKGKVEEMRHQQQLRTHMDTLNRAGHSDEAAKIAARLDPARVDPNEPKYKPLAGFVP